MMDELRSAAEDIERASIASMYDACPDRVRDALGLKLEFITDVAASIATREPSILLNRAHGLGSRATPSRETIDAVAACYRRHGIERFFFHTFRDTLPENGERWLLAAGLERTRGWMQFVRHDVPPQAVDTPLRITRIDRSDAESFARIACNAFDLGEAARELVAAMAGDERWQLFMSFDGDTPAGTGGLFVHEGCGYLSWGATDPAFRRRGSQAALMAARIQAASESSCRYLFTETGEAVAGGEQVSYRNILRAGFEPMILCENWSFSRGAAA
jgi:GNAT superfamily N-acetyltransferase